MCANTEIVILMLVGSLSLPHPDQATHPEEHCDTHAKIVRLLVNYPHYEVWQLALQDQMPGQGHKLDYFENNGEGAKHSYTLIRTKFDDPLTCIVSAGIVTSKYKDSLGRDSVKLEDETDPDIYYLHTCDSDYSIFRTSQPENTHPNSPSRKSENTPLFKASYGFVISDYRKPDFQAPVSDAST